MATIDLLTGFNGQAFDDRVQFGAGAISFLASTIRRAGGSVARFAPSAAISAMNVLASGQTNIFTKVLYVYFNTLPNVSCDLAGYTHSTNKLGLGYDTSTGRFCAFVSSGTPAFLNPAGPVVQTGVVYRVEMRINIGVSPNVIDIQVATADGTATALAQTALTGSGADSSAQFTIGNRITAATFSMDVTDAVMSLQSVDYPLGPSQVLGMIPTGVGTHSLDAPTSVNFFKRIAGVDTALTTAETISYQTIDEVPIDGSTDAIKITGTPTTAHYAEYTLAQLASISPTAVRAIVRLANEQAGSSTWVARLFDALQGANQQDIYNAVITVTTPDIRSATLNQRPNTGGAWTLAAVNALRLRYGFTASVAGIPHLEAAIIEVLAPVAGATLQYSRPSADVAAAGWAPTPGSPTTLFDKLNETSPDDTNYISATSS